MAESHSISEDGKVYTFKLRNGVKFHDGTTVTAEDVKYSIERCAGINGDGTPLVEAFSNVDKVEIPDELMAMIPQSKRDALTESLSQDPRPAYITEPDTPFGFEYAGFDVRFKVNGDTLTVYEIIRL